MHINQTNKLHNCYNVCKLLQLTIYVIVYKYVYVCTFVTLKIQQHIQLKYTYKMYIMYCGKKFELVEIDNDYFTLAKSIGLAGAMKLRPKLDNMCLSQILDICHCTLEMLPANYHEYLEIQIKQIKTLAFKKVKS